MSAIDTERVRADYLASMKRANWLAHVFGDIRGLCDEVRRLRAIVNELAIAYEDAIGCPPHISIGIVEPDRG